MTNYNERLDKALERLVVAGRGWDVSESAQIESMSSELDEAKQAITSLNRELVAEAKPYGKRQFRELIEDAWYEAPTAAAGFGRIEAIHNQYEQNLLKALETLE